MDPQLNIHDTEHMASKSSIGARLGPAFKTAPLFIIQRYSATQHARNNVGDRVGIVQMEFGNTMCAEY